MGALRDQLLVRCPGKLPWENMLFTIDIRLAPWLQRSFRETPLTVRLRLTVQLRLCLWALQPVNRKPWAKAPVVMQMRRSLAAIAGWRNDNSPRYNQGLSA